MMNLETLLNKPSMPTPKWLIFALIIVSFIGFSDATYLTVKHYLGTPITCSIFEGCEKVTTSPYATISGAPVALLGAIYYLTIFILIIAYFDTKKEQIIKFTARFTLVGFFTSLWFLYLQLFVIKAICFYCVISALTSIILFILGLYILKSFSGRRTLSS